MNYRPTLPEPGPKGIDGALGRTNVARQKFEQFGLQEDLAVPANRDGESAWRVCPCIIGVCWGWQNPDQGVMKAPVCLENIPGKPPSCVYDCVELLKYSEEYSKPPNKH